MIGSCVTLGTPAGGPAGLRREDFCAGCLRDPDGNSSNVSRIGGPV